jgi:hypothetical protein
MLPNLLEVVSTQKRIGENGDQKTIKTQRPGTPLWHTAHAIGEQVLLALDELGHAPTDGIGGGFTIKELAVTPDGKRLVIHLNVTEFQSQRRKKRGDPKPIPFLSLIHNKVVEQIRIRVSELLGAKIEVGVDNHFYVRYVFDLQPLLEDGPAGEWGEAQLVDHLDDEQACRPFVIPLGMSQTGEITWLDIAASGRHVLLTGSTGWGKTTWMDATVCTLVHNTPPSDLKMVFMDPQGGLNFSPYRMPEFSFRDTEGSLGIVSDPKEIITAMARLNREHHRRLELIAETPWGSLEGYNQHVDEEDKLPYILIFFDELSLLQEQFSSQERKAFERELKQVLYGGRKVGLRVVMCIHYLKGTVLPREAAAQAALTLAFHTDPQGSRNSLGDTSAAQIRHKGRFVADGLIDGRQVLHGLYVDRETVLELIGSRQPVQATYEPDTVVVDMIQFALDHLDGELSRDKLNDMFGNLMSRRQVDNFLTHLELIGLADSANRSVYPPRPRQLNVDSIEEAIEKLKHHPLRFKPDGDKLVFVPE